MPIITANGQIGSGVLNVATQVAERLSMDYIDQLILAEAAKRVGTTIEAIEQKEIHNLGLLDRIAHFIKVTLETSSIGSTTSEPYHAPGVEYMLSRKYTDMNFDVITEIQKLDDQKFINVTKAIIVELASGNNAVIVGRGSNIILRDNPETLHVGFIAPMELRIENIMRREHLPRQQAEQIATSNEKARVNFFKKFFNADPDDPNIYHLIINLGYTDPDTASKLILCAVKNNKLNNHSTKE